MQSYSALPSYAMPEFISGFMQGMDSKDYRTEIELCYTSLSPDILKEEL